VESGEGMGEGEGAGGAGDEGGGVVGQEEGLELGVRWVSVKWILGEGRGIALF